MTQPIRISLLLKTASDLKNTHSRDDQIRYLRTVYNEPMRFIIQGALHPSVEWLLPSGKIPFTPSGTTDDNESKLYREYKKLYMFCKGGMDNLDKYRRLNLFVQLLEALHPEDAELMLSVKDKSLPYPGIDYKLIQDAFPGMLPDYIPAPTKVVKKEEVSVEDLVSKVNEVAVKTPKVVAVQKTPHVNKGKTWWNDGVKNFLAFGEEASAKNFLPGRVKK